MDEVFFQTIMFSCDMYIKVEVLVDLNSRILRLNISKTTIVDRIYWDNYEKRYFFASHKQLKTLLREHMVKLKIISLYIYKDLRLKT